MVGIQSQFAHQNIDTAMRDKPIRYGKDTNLRTGTLFHQVGRDLLADTSGLDVLFQRKDVLVTITVKDINIDNVLYKKVYSLL